jgi:ribosomal protein L40E
MRELTDSYCERCGTRYTFGPTPAKGPTLAGARLLAKGLKNFVMTDGQTLDEALAAARIDDTRDESIRVAEEFHRTFNFCMSCRQYACDKCWNENQGACLSCAPLWDQVPETPEGHPVLRAASIVKPADIDQRTRADGSGDTVPWPAADPLPAQPPTAKGKPVAAAATSTPAPAPQMEPFALQSLQRPEPLPSSPPITQPFSAQKPSRPITQPLSAQKPSRPITQPLSAQKPQPEPPAQPQPAQPRPQHGHRLPSRVTEEERAAAEQLRTQAQSWRSRDDGWSLWPTGEEAAMTLTAEELQLVQAQLSQPAPEPDMPAAHVDAPIQAPPGRERQAAAPPAPAPPASSDFDLIGSLRGTIEFSDGDGARPAAQSEPAVAEADPHQAPGIGRLLGRLNFAAPEPIGPAPAAKPARPGPASKARSKSQPSPWPTPTPWVERPIERHDWWADGSADLEEYARLDDAAQEATATPEPIELAPEPEPIELEAETPAPTNQQPFFTLPPATAERWPEVKREPPVRREPAPRTAGEWPVSDPLEPAAVTPPSEGPSAWPPIGTSWPVQEKPAAPWPVAANSFAPAPHVAARQNERGEAGESPLVAALWAESAQQVQDRGSVRVCRRCALPVSTQARFCRRCGTEQA